MAALLPIAGKAIGAGRPSFWPGQSFASGVERLSKRPSAFGKPILKKPILKWRPSMRCHHLLLPAMLCLGSPAFAHAFLDSASPGVGSESAIPPAAVTITFTEDVEPDFSTIEVRNAQGVRVDKADPHLVGDHRNELAVKVPKLPPGEYTVTWHATSVDTHKTEGRFEFDVAR
jgi:copper resistance protein C